jgi:hypothetical protein
MPDRSFSSQLGQLALALVNATLMLAVLLVFGLWLLLGRVQDFAADTARSAAGAIGSDLGARMAERAAGLDATLASLASLDDRLDAAIARVGTAAGPAVAELGALRVDVRALTASVGMLADAVVALREEPADAVSEVLRQILQGLAARLGPSTPSPT